MRVFTGLSYDRDNHTAVCGVATSRTGAKRQLELHRNEILYWAKEATDGPDGGAGIDDSKGDCVGIVLAFDVCEDNDDTRPDQPSSNHGRLLWMLKRMLNPEDLGHAVPGYVRDEIREVLGMRRCEHAGR